MPIKIFSVCRPGTILYPNIENFLAMKGEGKAHIDRFLFSLMLCRGLFVAEILVKNNGKAQKKKLLFCGEMCYSRKTQNYI